MRTPGKPQEYSRNPHTGNFTSPKTGSGTQIPTGPHLPDHHSGDGIEGPGQIPDNTGKPGTDSTSTNTSRPGTDLPEAGKPDGHGNDTPNNNQNTGSHTAEKPDSGKPDSGKPSDNTGNTGGNHANDGNEPGNNNGGGKPDGPGPHAEPGGNNPGQGETNSGNPHTPTDANPSNPTGNTADANWSNQDKGRFGEAQTHEYMVQRGYDRIDTPAPHVNSNGIDAIYRSPDGDIVIVESKYGTSRLGNTLDGRQMSDDWLTGAETGKSRVLKAVNGDQDLADEILAAMDADDVQRLLSHIDQDGLVTILQLDKNGYVIRGVTPQL